MPIEQDIEEILERMWTLREQAVPVPLDLSDSGLNFDPSAAIIDAVRRKWLTRSATALALTQEGAVHAAAVIRRHRLAERLLFDVIQVDHEAMEAGACELEHSHILSEEATDRVCAFLGHPPTCPHDRPIPRGRCCDKFASEVRPLVGPLSDGAIGHGYRIVFIASRAHRRLDRLAAFGIVPGALVRLHQRRPTFMVQVGGTDVAIEHEVAGDIYVVPV